MTKIALIDCLRRSGAALDRLWEEAAESGSQEAIDLSDAAQNVHRALVTLSEA
ncbi:MAG: hypothetical protein KGQ66_06910 [Acidobacteriota bacterium]|nr:hypothetical protein [Acidobacteriota bacterium]